MAAGGAAPLDAAPGAGAVDGAETPHEALSSAENTKTEGIDRAISRYSARIYTDRVSRRLLGAVQWIGYSST